SLLEEGLAELPHVCRSVIIPDQAAMEASVLSADVETFAGLPVIPSKGNLLRTVDPADVPYRFDAQYEAAGWYPPQMVSVGEPYILRDYRGLVVEALPFQFDGAEGTLQVARRMTIELRANGTDLTNSFDRSGPPERVVRGFLDLYRHHFLNWGMDRYTPVPEEGSMLVITYDAFHSAMTPFVEWKNQQGLATTIVDVSTIGNNSANIQAYIQNLYDTGDLAYVLLVGDAAQVATPYAAGGASDPSYSLLAGGDRYPEIFVGRFSAENAGQVDTQVERTVVYEQTPMAGATWYHKGTGIASNQGPGDDGEYDDEHEDVIRQKLLDYGYTEVDQIYDPYGTSSMVTNALNDGRSIVNYTGHGSTTSWGSTGFSNSHVNALQNDWMLPYINSVACVNGDFDGTTCFGEAWLRATNNGNPTGAIGAYMSSINQSWNPPMCGQDEAIDLLVDYEMFTMGGLWFNGSCQMMDEYGYSSGGNMFLTWHIFGDPSLLVRTKTPETMTVQHDGAMIIGLDEYVVTVSGVVGARCALYAGGVLYGSAYTDGAGVATIPLDPVPSEPMTLTLTVTASNKIPVMEDVEVLPPSGPFLVFDSYLADDAAAGDGDGVCDAGEGIELTVTLGNVGVEEATGVTADLVTDDEYTEIQVGTASYGDILPGETGASQSPYELTLASNTPDNHVVSFQLMVHSDGGDWERGFTIPVCASVLNFSLMEVDDSPPMGNGSGWIAPDETFEVVLTLANTGHADAHNVELAVNPFNFYIEPIDGTATCEHIPAEGEGTFTPITLHLSPNCPVPSVLTVRATFAGDYGVMGPLQFPLDVGGFIDDCEADRGWTLGAGDDDATSGEWILADPVGTTYSGYQVQPEDDHTDPNGVQCFVTGNTAEGGEAGDNDVDGGKTTIFSPVFDLSGVEGATFDYWVWYTNNRGNSPNEDYWVVQVTADGAAWVDLENTTTSTNAWVQRTFTVEDYITLSDQVQFRFIASDEGGGSLVEAAVDDIQLIVDEGQASGADDGRTSLVYRLFPATPNPSPGVAQIRFTIPRRAGVDLKIFDVTGRLVRTLVDGPLAEGEHVYSWDGTNNIGRGVGSGIYYMRMQAPGYTQMRPITLMK
ncbi:MAG: hypothetical protein GF355_02740, partial [Candidatus Eisenbacteria bacterium]|nr:hypothetical protein [Candidatus Eisenbacteria bacterium]